MWNHNVSVRRNFMKALEEMVLVSSKANYENQITTFRLQFMAASKDLRNRITQRITTSRMNCYFIPLHTWSQHNSYKMLW